jgi:hypothetical protein
MYKQVYDVNGIHIGTFDGEFINDFSGKTILRVDGDEAYTIEVPCKYFGIHEENEILRLDGTILIKAVKI